MTNTLRTILGGSVLLAAACGMLGAAPAAPQSAMGARPAAAAARPADALLAFRDDGSLERPRGYRRWIFVGAPLTPDDMNDGHAAFPEFHSVYIDPASYDHYKRTGDFRDGTVLLKELSSVGTKASTSGKGYFMGEITGLEAAVKDSERFPDEPGNWAYFRFTDEDGGPIHRVAEPLPAASCAACHTASAEQDSVFTQHYPMLREARGYGAGEPEDR